MWAAQGGRLDTLRLLLDRGARLDAKTGTGGKVESGWTALMLALHHAHVDAARLLLDRGADVNAESEGGHSALTLVADSLRKEPTAGGVMNAVAGRERVLTDEERSETLGRLRQGGLRVGLREAALLGETETIRALLDGGAAVDDADSKGRTALGLAVQAGHGEAARLLLDRGADVNGKTSNLVGGTPLMMAAMRGDGDMVRLLIERGADVTARNRVGMSAVKIASRHPEIVAILEQTADGEAPVV
jgi:ankyrin repeat protein